MGSLSPYSDLPSPAYKETLINPNHLLDLFKTQQKYLNFFFQKLDLSQTLAFTQTLLNSKGTIFFTGVGKSGFVAQKISQTLVSLGIRSGFLSPVDALHGDIGILSNLDVVVFFSKSGNTEELLRLVPCAKAKGAFLIAVTSSEANALRSVCDMNVHLPLERELCPFDLAPVTSTAIQMVFGDTVAIALMGARNLTRDEYAANHPAGRIGKSLIFKVKDVMKKQEKIRVSSTFPLLSFFFFFLDVLAIGCIPAMDFNTESGFFGVNIPESSGAGGFENWVPGLSDQAIWATEDDYRAWTTGPNPEISSNSNYDNRQSQIRTGMEPPNKKSRTPQGGSDSIVVGNSNRSKAIGKMFFKTKLCCKFRAGVCPYITNCNFAHGIEELRRPPPNWQEIVAAYEEERGVLMEPREEHAIPTFSSSEIRGESQRSYKGRHCKKFYTEEGCPYGENCTFLHDEQSRARESVAISLSPTVGAGPYANGVNVINQKPSNWKTRICNKWETTGNCPFGSKCHFAHGLQELHKYGGGLMDMDGRDACLSPSDFKQGGTSLKTTDTVVASNHSVPHTDIYHMGVGIPSQRPSGMTMTQRLNQRPLQKWKGPDKISRIYGDWIDDIE